MANYRVPVLETFSWQPPVKAIQNDPPGSPVKGDRYLVAGSPTGAWATKAWYVATYTGSAWLFDQPAEGWAAWDEGANKYKMFNGTVWTDLTTVPTAHEHAGADITSGSLDGDRLAAPTTTKRGGVKATGTPSGKFLKDDDTWATPEGGGGDMTKAVYDTDADNIVDKAEAVDDGAGNATTAAQVKEAYTRRAAYDTDYKCLLFTI
jgi:hypothetical protein